MKTIWDRIVRLGAARTARKWNRWLALADTVYSDIEGEVGVVFIDSVKTSVTSVRDGVATFELSVHATRSRYRTDLTSADLRAVAQRAFERGRQNLEEEDFDILLADAPPLQPEVLERLVAKVQGGMLLASPLRFSHELGDSFVCPTVTLREEVALLGHNIFSDEFDEAFMTYADTQRALNALWADQPLPRL